VTEWRKLQAGALTALICLFGLTATVDAAGRAKRPAANQSGQHGQWDHKPTDHPKMDRKLNDRADRGGLGTSRVIITWKPGYGNNKAPRGGSSLLKKNNNNNNNNDNDNNDQDNEIQRMGGKNGRKLNLIGGQVVEIPNWLLRRLANHPGILSISHDRKTGGEMNRSAVVSGARAVQQNLGLDGAGIGVAVIDSGITSWHDDLTVQPNPYQQGQGVNAPAGGQRVAKFVDFVNGRTAPYDDNGHGSHVSGIILGNGYDTYGARAGIAPAATLVSLKVLDDHGGGYISNVIAALDWVVQNKAAYNIRVVNLSVGAAVTESYTTDPLTLAAKRVVDAGVVVVTAAGNLGKNKVTGLPQYGAITAPGNAPWVLTVGAYSHQGTVTRIDDKMAPYSSRGPTARDFVAKPDVVATGTGIVSLAVPGSTFYTTKAAYLLKGSRASENKQYLSLTGTSMAAPMVTGTVALMLQVNPKLTPNLVKALIEYTAQNYGYDSMTQGAGFLNTKGAVELARFLVAPQAGQKYPSNKAWSKTILWGNHKIKKGVIKPAGSAYALGTVWGADTTPELDNIVWGTTCVTDLCDNIVWGTTVLDLDNIVWGTVAAPGDAVVWGTADGLTPNIVWGTACGVVECDNIVWGTECGGADCDNIVWGTSVAAGELDNIVWGTAMDLTNIVWGTAGEVDNIVWGTSAETDNVTWGCAGEETPVFDDPEVPGVFDGTDFDGLFDVPAPAPLPTVPDPPPAVLPDPTLTPAPTVVPPVTTQVEPTVVPPATTPVDPTVVPPATTPVDPTVVPPATTPVDPTVVPPAATPVAPTTTPATTPVGGSF
jgi:serine protease AprX